jgi:hypothetical protein
MIRFSLLLPATALAACALAGSANAASYCVHQPGGNCRVGQIDAGANLAGALAQANASPADDHVFIGAGTYSAPNGGFVAGGSGTLDVTGTGATTILDGNTSPIITLGSSDLDGVAVHVRPASGSTGVLALSSSLLEHLTVSGGGGGANGLDGHVVARGTARRTTAGRSRVAVTIRGRLPRHATVTVTATFTPTHGTPISVRARLGR